MNIDTLVSIWEKYRRRKSCLAFGRNMIVIRSLCRTTASVSSKISSEHLGLFNKLYAINNGAGIGLALVKRIVEAEGER